jgi:endonuclease YncB( thermonuclease family)
MRASVFSILIVALLAPGAVQTGEPWRASGYRSVIDGDTIKLDDERIRLLDFDAPELTQTCTTFAGVP